MARTLSFFFNHTATTETYTLSLHDALPICSPRPPPSGRTARRSREASSGARTSGRKSSSSPPPRSRSTRVASPIPRSEEHTSELQSLRHLVCRLLLEKKNTTKDKLAARDAT